MKHKFEVEIEVEKAEGKKQSLGAISEALETLLIETDPDEIDVEDSSYTITSWTVTDTTFAKV